MRGLLRARQQPGWTVGVVESSGRCGSDCGAREGDELLLCMVCQACVDAFAKECGGMRLRRRGFREEIRLNDTPSYSLTERKREIGSQ